jgi:hypothetical protein
MYLLAKYNTQTAFTFPMVKRGVVDFASSSDWTPATGDTKISKDGGNVANTTNNPTAVGGTGSITWTLTLTATELQAAVVDIQIVDSATKAVEDQFIKVYTYGNTSAKIPFDFSDLVRAGLTALPNANAEAAGGLYTRGAGAGQINQPANGKVDTNVVSLASAAIQSIWDALTSALTTASSIGKLLVDNVNATISSRASQTSVDTVDDFLDTEIAAIKTKTDLLPEGIKKNQAFSNFMFMMLDSTTGVGKTGIADGSFTKKVSVDGGTPATISGTISEVDATNMPGWYKVNFTSGELNGDNIALRFAASGCKDTELSFKTSP